ncbi:MAG: hypothetical protein WCI47_00070 [bacterium]
MHYVIDAILVAIMLLTADLSCTPLKAAMKFDMGMAPPMGFHLPFVISSSEEHSFKILVARYYNFVILSGSLLTGWITYTFAGVFHVPVTQLTIFSLAMISGVGNAISDTAELKVLGSTLVFPSKKVFLALTGTSRITYALSILIQFLAIYTIFNLVVLRINLSSL